MLPHKIILTVSTKRDLSEAIVQVELPGDVKTFPLAVVPEHTYYWRLQPMDASGKLAAAARGTFTSGTVRLIEDAPGACSSRIPGHTRIFWMFPPAVGTNLMKACPRSRSRRGTR